MGIGYVELLLIQIIVLIYLVIPIATLIFVILIKRKVDRIESTLRGKDEQA